jgi:hypothetical protein
MENLKAEVFNILLKGIIISINSAKYHKLANYLNVDENFEHFNDVLNQIGYEVIGENGYFYLIKKERLSNDEVENFINFHKKTIVAISILKQIYPLISANDTITITDFIGEFNKKINSNIQDKLNFLFNEDRKTQIEELFKLFEKNFVFEKIDKNSYKVLNSINYFIKIVESTQ